MKRAYSVGNIYKSTFDVLPFEGKFLDSCGMPELTGSMFIYGGTKNGKTSFAMQFAKYLTTFARVAYNSVEEGFSLTIKEAIKRVNMVDVAGKFVLLDKESIDDLIVRLQDKRSAQVVFIDSIQFAELKFSEYKRLKEAFPNKLFVYISHIEGKHPEGLVARKIWRDANIAFYVEGFKAFPVGRYGGGAEYVINQERADKYWGVRAN